MRSTVVRLGNAVLGEWRSGAISRKPAMPASERQARQRRNSLSRLIKYRIENGLALGSDAAWAHVLGNTLAALRQEVTIQAVAALAARLGRPPIDPETIAGATADIEAARRVWHGYRLRTAGQVGSMLDVTSVERDECAISDIDAIDESARDRKRRLAKQRQQRRRGAGLKPAPHPTQAELARAAGVSLATWKRRHRKGEPNLVTLPKFKPRGRARVSPARVKSVTPNSSPTGGGLNA